MAISDIAAHTHLSSTDIEVLGAELDLIRQDVEESSGRKRRLHPAQIMFQRTLDARVGWTVWGWGRVLAGLRRRRCGRVFADEQVGVVELSDVGSEQAEGSQGDAGCAHRQCVYEGESGGGGGDDEPGASVAGWRAGRPRRSVVRWCSSPGMGLARLGVETVPGRGSFPRSRPSGVVGGGGRQAGIPPRRRRAGGRSVR